MSHESENAVQLNPILVYPVKWSQLAVKPPGPIDADGGLYPYTDGGFEDISGGKLWVCGLLYTGSAAAKL